MLESIKVKIDEVNKQCGQFTSLEVVTVHYNTDWHLTGLIESNKHLLRHFFRNFEILLNKMLFRKKI